MIFAFPLNNRSTTTSRSTRRAFQTVDAQSLLFLMANFSCKYERERSAQGCDLTGMTIIAEHSVGFQTLAAYAWPLPLWPSPSRRRYGPFRSGTTCSRECTWGSILDQKLAPNPRPRELLPCVEGKLTTRLRVRPSQAHTHPILAFPTLVTPHPFKLGDRADSDSTSTTKSSPFVYEDMA
jgi:hypothetical protein